MAFDDVRRRSRERLSEVLLFLNYVSSQEPAIATEITPPEVKMMRGLFYVHLYGAVEKTVNDCVETMLTLLDAKGVKSKDYSRSLLSVVLHDDIKSLKDSGYGSLISKSVDVFCKSVSEDVLRVSETVLSKNLQNIWINTLEDVFKSFGVDGVSFTPRQIATVNEIVDNRNAVAHGRNTAMAIGERHATRVLRDKMDIAVGVLNIFIDKIEGVYIGKDYLVAEAQPNY